MYDFNAFTIWYAVAAVIKKTPVSLLDAQMEFNEMLKKVNEDDVDLIELANWLSENLEDGH